MSYYPYLITFHILFAGMWLFNVVIDYKSRGNILSSTDKAIKNTCIDNYLSTTNIVGIVASSGILVTGVLMVTINPGYGFFEFSANHWLVSKQIIFIAIYAVIFAMLIPAAKKLRYADDSVQKNILIKKVFSLQTTINILVVLNIFFALSRRFM